MVFIGPEIPRLRAIIMLLFGSIALFIPVFKNKLLVLSITASIILFFLPDSIYSYSFYYSFIAVLGIFLSSTRKTIYMCVVIYLFLIPLNLHSSGTFDVNNILANSVVIPFFSFIYYPLNIILILLFVSGLHGVIYIMNLSTDVLLLLLRFFSHISDYTKIKTFNINTTEIIILYAVLILFFISIKYYKSFNRKKVIWFYSTVASIIVSTVLYLRYDHWNDKELINFELQKPKLFGGSGDIIFASTRSRNIVIDTGFGGFGSQKIIKEIKRKKIDNIDYLIITHSDADHAGGLADFLNEFYVRNVVISPSEYNYILQNGLIDKTNFIFACDGMSLDLDNTNTIKFIYPNCYYERKTKRKHNKKYHVRNKDRDKGLMWNKENNETVLSFIMTIGSYNFVISSDLPEKHLESILQKHKIESSNLIYQMPHHCNKKDNPPELLNSIKPILGFCTRDRKLLKKSILNPDEFDFPILMTGLCGDIGFRPENRGLEVFSQKCHKLSLQLKRT
ncbi:MAG: ComEC/Rec2 family competence protein [Proteobacteria bacterium]|nr:ComEC/Rec2 family competence protein [Pseudomonadota bacterium]